MSTDERKQIVREVIEDLYAEGFVVMPASVLQDVNKRAIHQKLLKQYKLTPYQIAKFKLIPGVSAPETIKNMVKDGRIGKKEFFVENGKWYIVTTAVKRLRGE